MSILRSCLTAGFLTLSVLPAWANTSSGNQIILNGKTYPGYWFQSSAAGSTTLAISDGDLEEDFGLYLLDNSTPQQQPVQWYSSQAETLSANFPKNGAVRYLDISQFSQRLGWQVQPRGNALVINSGSAQVRTLKTGIQPWGRRIVLELDRPSPWRLTELTNSRSGKTDRNLTLTVDASLGSAATQGVNTNPGGGLLSLGMAKSGGQTTLKASFAGGMRPEVWTLSNPPRLVVDIRPDPMRSRNIAWAPGLRWRESVISLGSQRFPVSWLEVNLNQGGLKLQPIWGNDPNQLVGTHPLLSTAARAQSAAAINAGFFDQKRQTPLGAIRRNGTWISSPILNRGVIAWNDAGQVQVGRLSLRETLATSTGQSLTVVSQDSGYPQAGIARYTPLWGRTYRPILGTEQIVTVVDNRVVSQVASSSAAEFPIPRNGSLLVARSLDVKSTLAAGTTYQSQWSANPSSLGAFPNIMGAGPLLVANSQVVLNVEAESFQRAFEAAAAPRSAIAQRADGTVLLVTSHNRVGGAGPTLTEWARVLQAMGGVNALNLDGGSSTTLYLGGRLVDRHPVTAARVQNALGVFLDSN
ncbi:phosphodiester glycosidase family protein [Lyngbya confervoides]|uniref:Phosphodiester glycosidase family protein n=1 Tax=Lyngbya confervoides BDU141951 TaxID=1574623 RepID=A0ABD4T6F1_9CYAN|nr:phosphodiester glycosidase family protein [Lyngbya confervoides]MCM1983847.1 phosphodiester glycosidase family protein [Lyngbya confervoides BDU141951]